MLWFVGLSFLFYLCLWCVFGLFFPTNFCSFSHYWTKKKKKNKTLRESICRIRIDFKNSIDTKYDLKKVVRIAFKKLL